MFRATEYPTLMRGSIPGMTFARQGQKAFVGPIF
jgi:hypothetical protein